MPEKEFKEMVVKILPELKGGTEELRRASKKRSIRKNQADLKNTATEMKNTLE